MTLAEAKRYEHSSDGAVRETAKRVIAANRRQKEMRKRHRDRAPGPTKAERRAAAKARDAIIRAAVMERAGEHCEWCGRDGFVLEWAHVIDGNGSRQAHAAAETTAGVCADCHHRGWHGSGARRAQTLAAARAWAVRLGFIEALAEIDKKITKAEEAQWQHPDRRSA